MAKNLLIVESPSKSKTIEKFLWPDYKVLASFGHIRDLPPKKLWIDIENNFTPSYEISKDKIKKVEELKKEAKKAEDIWIATDEDREWENIWWHLCKVLNLDPTNVKRIVFHEITKEAITNSIKNPRNIDLNLVDAGQARRLLDRLVWYKISPVLWQKIRKWLSAWRVQSVAVKLIVEREREINSFKPEESWKITTDLIYDNKTFKATFNKQDSRVKKFKSRQDVEKFLHTIFEDELKFRESKTKTWWEVIKLNKKINFIVKDTIKKTSKRSPWAPFTTSTLQQEAYRKFWFWVKQTMALAQKLYEWVDLWWGERTWLITYMRTDSLNLSKACLDEVSEVIKKTYWEKYYTKRIYKTKSKNAQEAHEAIRPTSLKRTPESLSSVLDNQLLKLYTLIYNRTLACQMSDALVEVTTLITHPENKTNQEWITKWEVIKFDWFMALYIEWNDDEDELEEKDSYILPDIKSWSLLDAKNITWTQSFSRPPARYTESSLVKKLESEWIWRPSTYAPIISTIMDRWYVEKFDKKYLKPTDIAFLVNDFLEKYFPKMMDYKFTRDVEEEFDKISKWKLKYQDMLASFWEKTLKKQLIYASEKAEKVIEKVWKSCPKCWSDLIYRYSKAGKFIGCSWYPECDYIEQPKEEKDALEAIKAKYEWKPCPDWVDWTIVVKVGKYGPFLASSEYPRVKWIWTIKSEKDEILEQILKERWLLVDEETWEEMVVKNSKKWQFLAAKNYPKVKITKNIPADVFNELKNRLQNK